MTSRKDWTGQKFGKLEFIKPLRKVRNSHILWLALCECGTQIEIIPANVASGKRRNCGCSRLTTAKDFKGKRHGQLTFIKPTKRRNIRAIIWKANCDCGNICYVTPGYRPPLSCGCLLTAGNSNRKYHPMISTARHVWTLTYKDGGLSFEDFFQLSQKNCEYCGSSPSNSHNRARKNSRASRQQKENGTFIYNGLDRIDSNHPHTLKNVVPCCKICNLMKRDMGVDYFLSHIERIQSHSSSRKKF